MALSLDYIGKFVIVMVTISVATTLIINWQGDIDFSPPTDNGEDGLELVEVGGSNEGTRLRTLVVECHDRMQQNPQTSFDCFLATSTQSGGFDITSSDLEDEVGNLENVDVEDGISGSTNVRIGYDVYEGKVLVEGVN